MRDHNKLTNKIKNIESFKISEVKEVINYLPYDNPKLKKKCIKFLENLDTFSSLRRIDNNLRVLKYFGILKEEEENIQLTNYGNLLKYSLKNHFIKDFLELLNYCAYKFNFTYHIIIEILNKLSNQEISGSSNIFSNSSLDRQFEIIKNRLGFFFEGRFHNRQLRQFTYILRKLEIIKRGNIFPILRDKIWRGVFLLSFSDTLKDVNFKKAFLITDKIIESIREPLFLNKTCVYDYLSMEYLHPFYKINRIQGNELYIQIIENITPEKIIENKL